MHAQAEEEAAWAAAQKEADTRRLAEEERRRKAERTVCRASATPAAEMPIGTLSGHDVYSSLT